MLWHHFAIRLGLALVLGAFIGAERQWRQGMTRDSIRAQHCGVRQRLERCLLIASEEAENGQDNRVVHPRIYAHPPKEQAQPAIVESDWRNPSCFDSTTLKN